MRKSYKLNVCDDGDAGGGEFGGGEVGGPKSQNLALRAAQGKNQRNNNGADTEEATIFSINIFFNS